MESVPYQGRVVAILTGMGNQGVVYLRLLKQVQKEYGVIL